MTVDQLKILVISDLHAHDKDPLLQDSPSYYSTDDRYRTGALNPLEGLAALIQSEGLEADWIVSPGDLGDKASASAQKVAWEELDKIRASLKAPTLIGTAGNHDVDSRRKVPDFDPKSSLQRLSPTFPIAIECFEPNDGVYADRYWSRNYVIVPFSSIDTTLIVINSSAFHGYSSDISRAPDEHLHGRLSRLTIESLRTALESIETSTNIVLMHHHVRKHPWIEDGGSIASGADKLIELLKDTERQWLIIHGHEHVPHLSYADGTPFAPIVLSSGSIAAKTYRVRGGHPRNQVHHIAIDRARTAANGVNLLGEVRSWTWTPEVGWGRASKSDGLPYLSGFGFRTDLTALRDKITSVIATLPGRLAKWAVLQSVEPSMRFLSPEDFEGLLAMLRGKGVSVQYDNDGQPSYLEIST